MIGIINYGSGNIQAIANIYNRLNVPFRIVDDPNHLKEVEKLILPGVGAFDATMKELVKSGLKDALNEEVMVLNKPVLGICVGMQILCDGSEEGDLNGLGWIKGKVKKFDILKIREIVEIVTDLLKFSNKIKFMEYGSNSTHNNKICSNDKLMSLGYEVKWTSPEVGLRSTIETLGI
jgi:imidazole glycerol phosphate synthase glutamine amidotransferase subunit